MQIHRSRATDIRLDELETLSTDVLVIGGGVAGFSAALAAAPDARVLVVTKDTARQSNTHYAQGGVAAVLGEEDSFSSHRDDTLSAGVGLCEVDAVEVVVSEGPDRIRELMEWGGRFDEMEGRLHLTLEGGHSAKRIVHAHGDRTGAEIQGTLVRRVRSDTRIELWEHSFAVDLVTGKDGCLGAIINRNERLVFVRAQATILATGGAGQVYRETTNPSIAVGDGFAMALRAGCRLRDMEFVQFHPTTLYVAGSARHLITEAVRGEGAYLHDMSGERFMVNYHPAAELAPRDVVSRSIIRHLGSTQDSHVFLDLRHLDPELVRSHFPGICEICAFYRIDPTKSLIPVHPSAHYMMGGISVDLYGRTEIPHLYACGEVASSGLHGANRLASNSLLEGLVFGRRAGVDAAVRRDVIPGHVDLPAVNFTLEGSVLNVADMVNSIKSLMWKDVGIVRTSTSLERAVRRLLDWSNYVFQCRFTEPQGWELVNLLTVATAIAESALRRTESRGAHFRTDWPEKDDRNWRVHSYYPALSDQR